MAVAYIGRMATALGADTKPVGLESGALLYETDTKKLYAYDGTTWDWVAALDRSIVTIGVGAAGVDYQIKIDGESNDFTADWMEDENYLRFNDDNFMLSGKALYFGATANKIVDNASVSLELYAGVGHSFYVGGVQEFNVSAAAINPTAAGGLDAGTENLPFGNVFSNGNIRTTGGRLALVGNAGDPATLVNGDVWHDSTTKTIGTKRATLATGAALPTTLYRNSADSTAITNTTSETDFDVVGASIPANSMVVGSCFWIRAGGKLSTTLSPTLTLKIKLSSTAVLSTAALTCNTTVTDDSWFIEGFVTVRSTGAGGTVMADGNASNGRSSDSIGAAAVVTVDTTAAKVPTISATWGALSVLNTITLQSLRVVQLW